MKQAVIVQGLGFGDEGKGATVDFLVRELSADLVVRYCGGFQAAHTVCRLDGSHHTFSQFGAGTLAGAATYLSQHVIVHIGALQAEAAHLRALGVAEPLDKFIMHPHALVATEYARAINRIRELARGAGRHGSCGQGIGETRRYWLTYGADSITAGDLSHRHRLADKLELQRQRMLLELQDITRDHNTAQVDSLAADLLHASSQELADEMFELGDSVQLSPTPPACQTAIFEGAQGVLLDEWRGFHPYTTWSTVTMHHALEVLATAGAESVCALGLTRAYGSRHGAGPFPTENVESEMVDQGNPHNDWQHGMRFGRLDLMLLRYAMAAAGRPLDGLVVNCLDELEPTFEVGVGYEGIDKLPVSERPDLEFQAGLTEQLESAVPLYETMDQNQLETTLAEMAPLAIQGAGRTWRQRKMGNLNFRPL